MRVLFVCSGNAFRSPVAEALLRKLRPDIQVDSAGINAAIPISEEARKYLAKENADSFIKKFPESLDSKQLSQYDLIVTMESKHKKAVLSKCPQCEDKTVVWKIEDPYFLPINSTEEIFNQIRQKVKELADLL
jgi:protein-tyrosine phosphatase